MAQYENQDVQEPTVGYHLDPQGQEAARPAQFDGLSIDEVRGLTIPADGVRSARA